MCDLSKSLTRHMTLLKRFFLPHIGTLITRQKLRLRPSSASIFELIIAIDRPSIDKTDAKKYITGQLDLNSFERVFEQNRQDFFDRMGELLREARKGEIKKSYAIEHFYTLDQVNNIVPTSSNSIDQVEFRAQVLSLNPVSIDDRLGDKFRQAHNIV